MVKAGGARYPKSGEQATSMDDSGNVLDSSCLYMNGPEIFNFTIKAVPKLVRGFLEKAQLSG